MMKDKLEYKDSPQEHKTWRGLETKVLDEEQGIVEHVFAVHGVLDEGDDISHPGSFAKTLTERGLKIRVLDHHQTDSILRVIAKPLSIREIDRTELPASVLMKYPEATGGVKATTQFLLNTPEGKGAFERIKAGVVGEWSYGFEVLDFDYGPTMTKGGKDIEPRNLRTVKLYEYSPVIWGMNPATATVSVKSDIEPEEEKVGRVLSKRNAEEIRSALGALTAVLKRAGVMDVEDEEEPEEEESQKSPPWHIAEQDGEFCVIVDEDDSVVKCYSTEAEAVAHMRALYANVEEANKCSPTEAGPVMPPTSTLAEIARLEIELMEV